MDKATNDHLIAGIQAENERDAPPAGFPRLPLVPAARYLDDEFYALEQEHIWKKSWLYAVHTDELPEIGSYKLWTRAGVPIIIVRAGENEFNAFYNTCSHRGAPLVQEESGRTRKLFVCPYHSWSYDLNGKLKAVRDPRDFPEFDKECHQLGKVRCETFGNWVFVNRDLNAPPLADEIAPFPNHWNNLQLQDMAHIASSSYELKCNVKILLDAFMESYHLASIHKDTVNRFLNYLGTYIQLYPRGNMLMITPQRSLDWQDPGAKGMPRIDSATEVQRVYNPSYHFFPNLVAPISDTGVPFLSFWPKDKRTMIIDSHWFAPRSAVGHENWPARIENWERILKEDTQFAPDIQKSMESGSFKGLTLSYQERRIYYWHEELDRRMGKENVPPEMRVKPMLDEFVVKS